MAQRRDAYVLGALVLLTILAGMALATLIISGLPSDGVTDGTPGANGAATQEGESGGISPTEILGWLAVFLTLLVGYRAYRLYVVTNRNTQLVVADFGNSSGIVALDGVAPGLSQLARQKLLEEMKSLYAQADRSRGGPPLLKEGIWLSPVQDTRLTDLIKAVAESVPDPAKPVVQLVVLLSSPRGTRVNGRLQLDGDSPGRVGISFEIVDIEGIREPEAETLWEEPAGGGRSPEDGGEGEGPPAGDPPDTQNSLPGAREAKASYELGCLYERRDALELSKTAFEEAAKKDPDNPAARAALARVLGSPRRTPQERYLALLGPATRWLAAELFRRALLETLPRGLLRDLRAADVEQRRLGQPPLTEEQRKQWIARQESEVYNFVGAYHMYGAPAHSELYRAAESNLMRAIDKAPAWYLPRENLADLYSYTGKQRRAIASYDAALDMPALPENVRRRIRLAKSMAQLQSGDEALRGQAVADTQANREAILAGPVRDARILYDLACWYSVAYAQKVVLTGAELSAKVAGRRCLAASLARDRDRELWGWAESDPDLQAIRRDLGDLKNELEAKLAQWPGLATAEGEDFWAAIDQVLDEAGW